MTDVLTPEAQREYAAIATQLESARNPLLKAAGHAMSLLASATGPVREVVAGASARRFAEAFSAFWMLKECPEISNVVQIEAAGPHGETMPLVTRIEQHISKTKIREKWVAMLQDLRAISNRTLAVVVSTPPADLSVDDMVRVGQTFVTLGALLLREASTGRQVRLEMLKPPAIDEAAAAAAAAESAAAAAGKARARRMRGAGSGSNEAAAEVAGVAVGRTPRRDKKGGGSRIPGPLDSRSTVSLNPDIVDVVSKELVDVAGHDATRYSRHHEGGAGGSDGGSGRSAAPGTSEVASSTAKKHPVKVAHGKAAVGPRFPAELQCTEFVLGGSCPRGQACPLKHADKCPLNNRGGCGDLGCPLVHVALCRDRHCPGPAKCAYDHVEASGRRRRASAAAANTKQVIRLPALIAGENS